MIFSTIGHFPPGVHEMLTKTMRIFPGALPGFSARKLLQALLEGWKKSAGKERDTAELRLMTDHELKDLGIGRGEIPALVNEPRAWRWDRY